jgi:hypothetical protein
MDVSPTFSSTTSKEKNSISLKMRVNIKPYGSSQWLWRSSVRAVLMGRSGLFGYGGV